MKIKNFFLKLRIKKKLKNEFFFFFFLRKSFTSLIFMKKRKVNGKEIDEDI